MARDPSTSNVPIATYQYKDERGRLLYEVLRYEPKTFKIRRNKKSGGYIWGLGNSRRVPYRLPELLEAAQDPFGATVYVVEGEKDVDTLTELGHAASTSRSGPGVFQPEWTEWYRGVGLAVVIADKDDAGRKNALRAYRHLSEAGVAVKIVECVRGKDVTDHLDDGGVLRVGATSGLTDVTLAYTASVAATTNGTNGASTGRSAAAEACADWALAQLWADPPEGSVHNGRQAVAYKFAQQLRDVDAAVAHEAMRMFWMACPQVNSEGAVEGYGWDQAHDTLMSALGSVPEDWTPGVFAGGVVDGSGGDEGGLAREIERIRIRRAAVRAVDQEEWDQRFEPPPYAGDLAAELALDSEALKWSIEGIHALGSNTTVLAQKKTGKTVLQMNLARSLSDGVDFLGRFPVSVSGNVAVWNYELSRDMFREWCRDLGFRRVERVFPLNLRGFRVPLWTERGEEWAIEWLKRFEIKAWLVDPFGRAYRGAGEGNSNDDVDKFLGSLDYIKQEAGVSDLFMSLHMGHSSEEGSEHARGASALEDWPDHRWIVTREGGERYFRVGEGRQPEEIGPFALQFNQGTREITLSDVSKEDARIMRHALFCVEALRSEDGQKTTELKDNMKGSGTYKNPGIKLAQSLGWVESRADGKGKSYWLKAPPSARIQVSE